MTGTRWRLRAGIALLVLFGGSATHAQVDSEPMFTLDFQNVAVDDVIRSLETIVRRPIAREGLAERTITLAAGAQLPARDVIPVTSFALSLVGLTIVETAGRELKVEELPGPPSNCARPRADLARLTQALDAGPTAGDTSFRFAAAPAIEVVRAMAEGFGRIVALTDVDPPSGELTLRSEGQLRRSEAYRLLFAALEREGNVVLEGPSHTFAVVGCARGALGVRASTEGPRVLGTLVGTASALALIDEPADFTIRRYAPGDLFPDGATQVLQIQVDAVVLGRREGCTLLIPGESGRGRSVACPAPPAHDPPETSSERRR